MIANWSASASLTGRRNLYFSSVVVGLFITFEELDRAKTETRATDGTIWMIVAFPTRLQRKAEKESVNHASTVF